MMLENFQNFNTSLISMRTKISTLFRWSRQPYCPTSDYKEVGMLGARSDVAANRSSVTTIEM